MTFPSSTQKIQGLPKIRNLPKIWDLPIRLFHWSLVLALIFLYFTAEFSEWMTERFAEMDIYIDVIVWHSRAGYFVLTLLLFRILWGFFGSKHARFASMPYSPKIMMPYIKSLRVGSKLKFTGHNPLGSYSVFVMLTLLLLQTFSGLFADDEIAFTGPLAQYASDGLIRAMTNWHHINFDLLKIFIGIHLLAILAYQLVLQEPLIRRMTRGEVAVCEPSSSQMSEPSPSRQVPLVRALVLYIMCIAVVYIIVI